MIGFAYCYSGFTCCRRISVSTKLSFFPEILLHVGTSFMFMSFELTCTVTQIKQTYITLLVVSGQLMK